MGTVFDPRRSPNASMTTASQLEAFRNRAYVDGDWSTWNAVQDAERAAADHAAARRRARLDAARALPPKVITGAGIITALAVVGGVWWLLLHPLILALIGGVTGTAAALAVWRWWRSRRVVRPLLIAPPALAGGMPANASPLDLPLTGAARALVDALAPARRRLYLDALARGVIAAPEVLATATGRTICAQLPGGQITPTDVELPRMAQTLGLHADQVRHLDAPAGTLAVEVLDVRPRDLDPGPWPHLRQACDWTAPVALGVDERGALVRVPLAGRRVVVMGQSGSGKTRFMRMLGLAALSDPSVQVIALDMKRSPASRGLREAAAWSHSGPPTDALRDRLQALNAEMEDRYRAADEGEDVIATRGWIVLWADEVQDLWGEKWAEPLISALSLKGREAGIGMILGTQVPRSKRLPTDVLAQADVRVLLRCPEPWAQQMVLEQTVPAGAMPKGHGWLWDDGDLARVASFHVNDEQAAAHLAGLDRPALPAAPRLKVIHSAPNAGEDAKDTTPGDLLGRVASALGTRAGMTWPDLAAALDEDEDDLRARLRSVGIGSASFRDDKGGTSRGVRRSAVLAALTGTD